MFFQTVYSAPATSLSRKARKIFLFVVMVLLLPVGLPGKAQARGDCFLDSPFGENGHVSTDFSGGVGIASAIALQPDGKIILVGSISHGDFAFPPPIFGLASCRAAIQG